MPRHWGYPSLIDVEHGMAAVSAGMHRVGMFIDQSDLRDQKGKPRGRAAWDVELQKRADFWRGDGNDLTPGIARTMLEAGVPKDVVATFNPNSRDQIGALLFERWDLPLAENVQAKDLFTKSGERSTGDAVLRSYVGDQQLTDRQRAAIHALRMYRRWIKMRGTFVKPFEVVRDEYTRQIVWHPKRYTREDGRIHPDYRAFGTKVGRLAASGPNTLNWPASLRSMCVATPDEWLEWLVGKNLITRAQKRKRVLVGADQDALHLRIIASLWNIPSLLEAFLGKPRYHRCTCCKTACSKGQRMGPHELFAELLFGNEFMKSAPGTWPTENPDGKWKGEAKGLRDCAKTVRYAGAYGAQVPTIYREVTSAEDKETGALPFAKMTMEQIEDIRGTWLGKEPQWEDGWTNEIAMFKELGYLESPILGRRAWFLEAKETDMVNFRVLGTEADLMNLITCEFAEALPFEYDGYGTGLVQQNYDSLLAECAQGEITDACPDGVEATRVANLMRDIGSRTLPGFKVPFVMDPKVGAAMDLV